jgi:benzil reductase ((S)-benzoin forming)
MSGFCGAVSERFGRVDLWVNNAGVVSPIGKLADVDPGMVAHMFAVNVNGVANGSRSFARHVRSRHGGGVLINITSGASKSVYSGFAAYGASKAAVDQMTAVVAEEERLEGLRAYALSPGHVDTDMQDQIRSSTEADFPALETFLEAKRLGEFNTPDWVADFILELAFGTGDVPSGSLVRVPDMWRVDQ